MTGRQRQLADGCTTCVAVPYVATTRTAIHPYIILGVYEASESRIGLGTHHLNREDGEAQWKEGRSRGMVGARLLV